MLEPQEQPPDLAKRARVRERYFRLQAKWGSLLEMQKNLQVELEEKELKVQRLQDEVDAIIDQVHSQDYAHLRPAPGGAMDDYFESNKAGAEEQRPAFGPANEGVKLPLPLPVKKEG